MAWIKVIDEHEATGAVKRVYEGKKVAVIRKAAVGEIVKVFSLRPDLLEARTEFGPTMTFGGRRIPSRCGSALPSGVGLRGW